MRTIHRDIVGAFIISKDGKVVLGKSAAGGVYTNLWIPPGGGIEAGESMLSAIHREVLEEVNLDITQAHIEALRPTQSGHSEKTLKDTGERVMVDMTFHNFKILLDQPAAEVPLTSDDDYTAAQWFSIAELEGLHFSDACAYNLKKLGYLG